MAILFNHINVNFLICDEHKLSRFYGTYIIQKTNITNINDVNTLINYKSFETRTNDFERLTHFNYLKKIKILNKERNIILRLIGNNIHFFYFIWPQKNTQDELKKLNDKLDIYKKEFNTANDEENCNRVAYHIDINNKAIDQMTQFMKNRPNDKIPYYNELSDSELDVINSLDRTPFVEFFIDRKYFEQVIFSEENN
jgi:hypothetical protein